MSCVDAGRAPGLFFPVAWASRCYLHVFGLTSDSFPSEQFPPSTNNLGREHSKSHVGLAQVLLILAVMVIPSAVQALEDWRKSLNWRWLVPITPIVIFVTTSLNRSRLWALQQTCCAERACKPGKVLGRARTAVGDGVSLFGRLPPAKGCFPPAVAAVVDMRSGVNNSSDRYCRFKRGFDFRNFRQSR